MQTDKIQLVAVISGMGPIERFLSASIWCWKMYQEGREYCTHFFDCTKYIR